MFSLSPIKRKDLDRAKTYAQLKYCEIKSKLHSCFEHAMDDTLYTIDYKTSVIDDDSEMTGKEIILELKKKIDSTSKSKEKMQILSVLPSSWTTEKIVNIFGASTYMVKKVKEKVQQDGILFIPDENKGHPLLKIESKSFLEVKMSVENYPAKKNTNLLLKMVNECKSKNG